MNTPFPIRLSDPIKDHLKDEATVGQIVLLMALCVLFGIVLGVLGGLSWGMFR